MKLRSRRKASAVQLASTAPVTHFTPSAAIRTIHMTGQNTFRNDGQPETAACCDGGPAKIGSTRSDQPRWAAVASATQNHSRSKLRAMVMLRCKDREVFWMSRGQLATQYHTSMAPRAARS